MVVAKLSLEIEFSASQCPYIFFPMDSSSDDISINSSILFEQSCEITTPACNSLFEFTRLEILAKRITIPKIQIGSITFTLILI